MQVFEKLINTPIKNGTWVSYKTFKRTITLIRITKHRVKKERLGVDKTNFNVVKDTLLFVGLASYNNL